VNGNYKAEEKRLWNRKREKVMLENIKASIKGKPDGLVVCGFEHKLI